MIQRFKHPRVILFYLLQLILCHNTLKFTFVISHLNYRKLISLRTKQVALKGKKKYRDYSTVLVFNVSKNSEFSLYLFFDDLLF